MVRVRIVIVIVYKVSLVVISAGLSPGEDYLKHSETTHQSSRDEPHAVNVVAERRHLSSMSIKCDRAVAAGNVKYTNYAVTVTHGKLRRVMTTCQ